MAQAKAVPDLAADDSYAQAAVRVVSVRAEELIDHAAGVLDTTDIERVHDMRVASRRLRAALEIFEPCFPRKRFRRVLLEVKRLADALGARRDADVAIAATEQVRTAMTAGERVGVTSFIELLSAEQAAANQALAGAVSQERLEALRAEIDALLSAAAPAPSGEELA